MYCILKLLLQAIEKTYPIILPLLVLYLGIKYDRGKTKRDKIEKLKNELIITCQKLLIYGVHYEYRTLYANYLEATLYIKPHNEYFELDKSIFLINYETTETAGNNFYLCKADLLKCKEELTILWKNKTQKNDIIKYIDIILLADPQMYRGKFTNRTWTDEKRKILKREYQDNANDLQKKFFESKLALAICDILKLLSPDILSHLKDKLSQKDQEINKQEENQ